MCLYCRSVMFQQQWRHTYKSATRGSSAKERINVVSVSVSVSGQVQWNDLTHKIIPRPQPVHAVFLQQALQEGPGCAGRTWAHRQWLVEDVVIHLMCVPAVEWWLEYEKKNKRHSGNIIRLSVPKRNNKTNKRKKNGPNIKTHQAKEHFIQHWTQTPPIYCVIIRLLPQDLRS